MNVYFIGRLVVKKESRVRGMNVFGDQTMKVIFEHDSHEVEDITKDAWDAWDTEDAEA